MTAKQHYDEYAKTVRPLSRSLLPYNVFIAGFNAAEQEFSNLTRWNSVTELPQEAEEALELKNLYGERAIGSYIPGYGFKTDRLITVMFWRKLIS